MGRRQRGKTYADSPRQDPFEKRKADLRQRQGGRMKTAMEGNGGEDGGNY
jgi:hypothetical protein